MKRKFAIAASLSLRYLCIKLIVAGCKNKYEIFQNKFIVMKCTVDNDYVNGSTQYHCSALSERLQK